MSGQNARETHLIVALLLVKVELKGLALGRAVHVGLVVRVVARVLDRGPSCDHLIEGAVRWGHLLGSLLVIAVATLVLQQRLSVGRGEPAVAGVLAALARLKESPVHAHLKLLFMRSGAAEETRAHVFSVIPEEGPH